ncbi:hypothetical protein O0I10_005380 [Lichtheimia ornata]|uniref:CCHC-type domain-containing protein n=1 Tax=Lichtheimia ornata TaxID=688661 RepID=A0AAD7V452_9FUNG|nr:uncharacterized protein O0I10_005380 [Lichtheimia ornata]KAJ8658998.1 hypothetical protein O0I10_005380 [Lichtheimia ornata]
MSSANFIKSPDKASGTQNSQQRHPSYAHATRAHPPIKESLISKDTDNTIRSRVWKVGGSPASCPSMFFDFTSRPENRAALLCYINECYPDNCGVRLHSDQSRRIVELFLPTSKQCEETSVTGITFDDGECILASKPISADTRLVHLQLSDLPFTTLDKLRLGLRKSLAPYGSLSDYGIFRDHASNLFMGRGYATLKIPANYKYKQLSHTIPWLTSDDSFHATWAEMPLHCLRCHTAGHATSACPRHPSRSRLCWTCGQPGHRAAQCTNRQVKPTPDTYHPPTSSSPSSYSVNSSNSDISMLSVDPSPFESHNDAIISDFIPDDQIDLKPQPPSPDRDAMVQHVEKRYPMSDHAKTIIASLSIPELERLCHTLKDQGKSLSSSTPTTLSSVSSLSKGNNDPT